MSQTDQNDVSAIAVLDLGGQYCHMIGRRLRDIGVRADIFGHDVSSKQLARYAGIILSGGPQSVYDSQSFQIDEDILELGKPVLGICYGHQLIAHLKGAVVEPGSPEYGKSELRVGKREDILFEGTKERQIVWMSHGDSVQRLPDGMEPLAQTASCRIAAYADHNRQLFGVQFHPEVAHTEFGTKVLENFSRKICRIRSQENVADLVKRLIEEIRTRVGERSVFFFVSGGVDSTVAFSLCARALPPNRVLGVYVDTGLMRKNETEELTSLLSRAGLSDRLRILPKQKDFLRALAGVIDPEEKRQIIGRTFVEVQKAAMQEYGIDGDEWLLGQGTIYPDTIESGGHSGTAALIKTHHNRCEEIRQMIAAGKVIEPLAEFYKDEVRHIGEALALDHQLTERWPFPGPGLAIRTLCASVDGKAPVRPIKLGRKYKDYEAVRFPLRTVGVQGDFRTYRDVVAVRGPLVYDRLSDLSTSLCNLSGDYNRVIVEVAGKTSGLSSGVVIPATLSEERLALLRDADYIARIVMQRENLTNSVWQFPVVLVPVSFSGGESVVLRPVNSTDGMTANFARVRLAVLKDIGEEILKIDGVDKVFLDVSDKPPATIEWE